MDTTEKFEKLDDAMVNLGVSDEERVEYAVEILDATGTHVLFEAVKPGKHYEAFVRDMENADYEVVRNYRGRNGWAGPAVFTTESDPQCSMSSVLAATIVPCQWDNMGHDYVVYPKARERTW